MISSEKVTRLVNQETKTSGFDKPELYKPKTSSVIFGSESNANFVDVISVGPITSIDDLLINDTSIDSGEFPLSKFYTHLGDSSTSVFAGSYPYVERTSSIGQQADITEGDDGNIATTTIKRSVSGKGVSGIKVNFTTSQFIHKDDRNRRKVAKAAFILHLLDSSGTRVKSTPSTMESFYCSNPTTVTKTMIARDQDLDRTWDYEIEIKIRTNEYNTTVAGSWSASTVTELFKDTQTYDKLAICSGRVVASDVSGAVPKRQYLVKGYKVDVPVFDGPNGTFVGNFTKETSSSHAWNAMAVLVDDVWGAGLDYDKIDVASFKAFDDYCTATLNGKPRYACNMELVKGDSYFRVAQQIVGAADGKLYEDTSGRVGITIDQQTSRRRVITSYDVVGEKVKRTTVPERKKVNRVEVEFSDKENGYQKTILFEEDPEAIVLNGVIPKKLKLDTCTDADEARRVAKRVLAVSQINTTTYSFDVGHNHEDVEIGEVVDLYDRNWARVNYCGKVAEGTTNRIIKVNRNTPIDLTGIPYPQLVLDDNRGTPDVFNIESWSEYEIVIAYDMPYVPEVFTSFAVKSQISSGVKATSIRVMGVNDNNGILKVEGLEYNHSLYDYVEFDGNLFIPITRILPDEDTGLTVTGLSVSESQGSLQASWDSNPEATEYVYLWKTKPLDGSRGEIVDNGITTGNQAGLPAPLIPNRYEISVYASDGELLGPTAKAEYNLLVNEGSQSDLQAPQNLGIVDGTVGRSGAYTGRSLSIAWDATTGTTDILAGYVLRITEGVSTLEKVVDSETTAILITNTELNSVFGAERGRTYTARVFAYDSELKVSTTTNRTLDNLTPFAPLVNISEVGDLEVNPSSGSTPPEDTDELVVYVWQDNNTSAVRPTGLQAIRFSEFRNVLLPDDTITFDGLNYNFEIAWVDTFGEVGANFTRVSKEFYPDALVPLAPTLVDVVGIDSTTARVNFTHDGTYLNKIQVEYSPYGKGQWTTLSKVFTLPVDPLDDDFGYDIGAGSGFFWVEGLGLNTEYEFRARAANVASAYSDYSNVVNGTPLVGNSFEDIEGELEDIFGVFDPRYLIAEGVNDAWEDLDLSKNIIVERTNRQFEDGELTASLTQFRSDYEDNNVQVQAQYQELVTTVAANDQAITQKVELLEAVVDDNVAEISRVDQAVATETEARAIAIQNVEASIQNEADERSAAVNRIDAAIVEETQARAVAISQVQAEIESEANTRLAQVENLSSAIVTEGSIRASADQNLSARISSNEDDIDQVATVAESAVAAIGYCSIGGSPSGHDTQLSCQAAGGTWVESPLSDAVRNVQVSTGGQVVTVSDHYQAYKTLEGELVGKATLGVTTGGKFTGIDIIGSTTNYSKITFTADVFELEDTDGNQALYYDADDDTWNFSGTLEAANGTFSGTVTASTISGSTVQGSAIEGGTVNISDNFLVDPNGKVRMELGNGGRVVTRDDLGAGIGALSFYNGEYLGVIRTAPSSVTCVLGETGPNRPAGRLIVQTPTNHNNSAAEFASNGSQDTIKLSNFGSGAAVDSYSATGIGVNSTGGTWAFYDAGGGYGPFTGGHEGLIPKSTTFQQGDILCDKDLACIHNISNAIMYMDLSHKALDRSVRGVVVRSVPLEQHKPVSVPQASLGYLWHDYDAVIFNAVGEGAMNVCGQGGDLETGDYICSSDTRGKGMKQPDQSCERPYTIAQVRHNVTFDYPDQVKQVAVIYLRG